MNFYPTLKCPLCGGILPNRQFHAGTPMTCPSCFRQVQLADWYRKLTFRGGIVITGILCYLLGFRGVWLFVAIMVGFFPGILLWAFVLAHTISTRFEPYPPGGQAPPPIERKD